MPLLRDYTAEHERVINLGADAIRALDAGDTTAAQRFTGRLATQLRSHWRGEEDGIFAALLNNDDIFAAHIEPLIAEHRSLDQFLTVVDLTRSDHRDRLRAEVDGLQEHIAKEEDSLFPASLSALGGHEWDAAISAWQRAHPGEQLLES
ncbi:hypothetical protein GOHSU_22_00950 [Gordonia hirsuta DSM 44140 = NBRC 16056]|uniref:Hemerythrin-like domain-containing protein n=1 Tax=Gordonia hirsuta DSM 44140 = NBRC 16056 TaxID=1121927 RepID=L7L912_9ACTN|nr:hemerythrin domain-containing protein [Gordonia hirsuta]GAC57635.1 hypothetical protein GOHSU_22_00950 [Gordonia hirsuta DSM 44140 = NBRC 16056]